MHKKFLSESSAPRIPKSEKYWRNKGKTGKDVCLIFHDDLDGVVSAIIMKEYLIKQGFNIVQYGLINYQESWQAFSLNSKLITVALDFAEDLEGVDVYIDHHGTFLEGEQKNKTSKKTDTGSAAEGIAQQIGVPFSKDTKDWIDMVDSAKYDDYGVDIRDILDFDLTAILKDKKAKLRFAGAFNQLLKRGDHKTFIEVVHSSKQVSIYNLFRLFKLFYPKNNPDWRSGVEPCFVEDGIKRVNTMQIKTRSKKKDLQSGYDVNGNKIIYNDQQDFWKNFAVEAEIKERDADGNIIKHEGPKEELPPEEKKWQLKPVGYQIIGNLMYVPGGTWANALRAKAIYLQDMDNGIVPNDPKLNFVLLQYGNTLQVADVRNKIKDMKEENLPVDAKGNRIDNLGKYCEGLVKNFETYLAYQDERTKAGGHWGIGSISNIFGKCNREPYEEMTFLDLFKNKIINDISGVKWGLKMPWNESEDHNRKVPPEEVNKKLLSIPEIRTEEAALCEIKEKELFNYIISNNIQEDSYINKFKTDDIRKLYEIWLDTGFNEIRNGTITKKDISSLYFKNTKIIEKTILFSKLIDKFQFNDVYLTDGSEFTKNQRKQLKGIFVNIIDMVNDEKFINKNTNKNFDKWI